MANGVGEKGPGQRLAVLAALLAAVVLVAAGCGGGSKKVAKNAPGTLQPAAADAAPGSTVPQSVSGGGGGAGSTSATATGRARAKGSTSTPSSQAGKAPDPTGPAPAQPGTYRYTQTGTYKQGTSSGSVPPEGTLVIDPPAANGTELWHRYPSPGDQPADTTVLFNPSGMFIQSAVEHFSGLTVTCTLVPPLPSPPWPPAVGQSFTSQGTCTGQGVTATIHVDGNVNGMDSLPLDGRSVAVYVVTATITIDGTYEGNKIHATDQETDWFAPSLRLPVKTHSVIDARYLFLTFSADTTSTLESGRPS